MDLLCSGPSRLNQKVPQAPTLSDATLIFVLCNMPALVAYIAHLSHGGKQRKWKRTRNL